MKKDDVAKNDVTFVIMVGIEGSGRTKFAREQFFEKQAYTLACYNENDNNSKMTLEEIFKKIGKHLQEGSNVVLDSANFILSDDRKKAIKLARKYGAEKVICCWMDLPYYRCAANLANVLIPIGKSAKQMGVNMGSLTLRALQRATILQPPSNKEGFDEILRITEEEFGLITE